MAEQPTIEVRNLRTHFFTKAGVVKAVDDVSFYVMPGEFQLNVIDDVLL